jgi:hypothetical protein
MTTYKGVIQINRCTGSKTLFRSNLNNSSYMNIKILQAEECDSYGEKKTSPTTRLPLIDIDLSNSQFAELITTMNIGEGVPCTIKGFDQKRVDQTGLDDEVDAFSVSTKYFMDNLKKFALKLADLKMAAKEVIDKSKLNTKYKEGLSSVINQMEQEIKSNMPFYVQQFEGVAEKVVTECKTEVDAYVSNRVTKLGLEVIKNNQIKLLKGDY